jgi:hypothetical protein
MPGGSLRTVLIEHRLASEADLDALDAWPAYQGLSLPERLYRSGLVPDPDIVAAFKVLGAVDGTGQVISGLPSPAALGAFSRGLAEKHRALPLAIERRRLIVALLDPSDTSAIEKLTFSCGLVIEPRSCRPRALFEALGRAYDVTIVRPDGGFLAARRRPSTAVDVDADDNAPLPPPSPHLVPLSRFGRADARTSPIGAAVLAAVDGPAAPVEAPPSLLALAAVAKAALERDTQPERDLRPARTERLPDDVVAALQQNPPTDLITARDSLPPQVLRLLVPPLRTCALFLVRKNVAVGWDVASADGAVSTGHIRDVLVPLSAQSVLADACAAGLTSLGNARDPTTMERTLFRFLRVPPPRAFAAVPVVAGRDPIAVLYVDRDGPIDDALLDDVRRAGAALGDALAPLALAGALFPGPALHPVQLARGDGVRRS